MAATQEVRVPDIGDFKEVAVIEILVKVGDHVEAETSLITVESDKATMEIPSPTAGVVREIKLAVGDKVAEGSLVLMLDADVGQAAPSAPAPTPAPAPAPKQSQPAPSVPVQTSAPRAASAAVTSMASAGRPVPREPRDALQPTPHASPSVRKFARELGVDLHAVTGTGPKGRIQQADVQALVKSVMSGASATRSSAGPSSASPFNLPAWPEVDFAKFGPIESVALSRIQKLSGPYLHRNWVSIPHITQFDEADITDLEEFRKSANESLAKSGVKLTMLAFVIKASVSALKKFPAFNASLDAAGENLILKHYYNIGFAADTPNGLVVPVVKNADQKGVAEIAREMGELSAQAREGKLKPADMQGASFTISSLGGIGGTAFTPIINAPEVAILGLSKSAIKPVWDGKAFAPRLMLPLSLSYDHRVIDGALGARFAVYLGDVLADMRKTLL